MEVNTLGLRNPSSSMEVGFGCPWLELENQNFTFLGADMSLVMQNWNQSSPQHQASPSSDYFLHTATGYLQDALVDLKDQCKKRKTLFFPPCSSQATQIHGSPLHNDWNWDLQREVTSDSTVSGEHSNFSLSCLSVEEAFQELKSEERNERLSCVEERISGSLKEERESFGSDEEAKSSHGVEKRKEHIIKKKKKKVAASSSRVAYPFAVVKPSGVEGDVTLRDINRRILTRPTRPIQHPVGDYATLPPSLSLLSHSSSALSGKAVVGLTRIHTRGTGTITIIRTKD
ncbi:uncharacterized protein LOC18439268 [Amborella trichopoda]|uniref:uncharacterized protein LOC18439268 n=1 Tax=Amborella trichopoda TaxID=13333 RepID=UPI0009BD3E81|nr:uncharacterized protein LOC18439268 [Amborella trichopoda]|eukprot:XP_020526013.1 uncharacterized protein LOC18439268 [Amborella trichopoda]